MQVRCFDSKPIAYNRLSITFRINRSSEIESEELFMGRSKNDVIEDDW